MLTAVGDSDPERVSYQAVILAFCGNKDATHPLLRVAIRNDYRAYGALRCCRSFVRPPSSAIHRGGPRWFCRSEGKRHSSFQPNCGKAMAKSVKVRITGD